MGDLSCPSFKKSGSWIRGMFSLNLDKDVNARYVKFSYQAQGPNYFCWTSEAAVFGASSGETSLKGDVDGNGKVNAMDYLQLKRYVLKNFTPSDAVLARMDVNGDKKIDARDYGLVKRIVLHTA
ncbi:MAG: dockerin type I repeat-containing protein [Clostridia bacterium]|nr:dockerin type I repeat-containing protein [Clostridia bacterium]